MKSLLESLFAATFESGESIHESEIARVRCLPITNITLNRLNEAEKLLYQVKLVCGEVLLF